MAFILFNVIAFLVAELFKILLHAKCNRIDAKYCKIAKCGIPALKSTVLKFCKVDVLQELHIVMVVMMSP